MSRPFIFVQRKLSGGGGLEKMARALIEGVIAKKGYIKIFTEDKTYLPSHALIERIPAAFMPLSFWKERHFLHECKLRLANEHEAKIFGMERASFYTASRLGNGVHAVYLERRKLVESKFKKLSFSFNPLHRFLLREEKKMIESPKLETLIVNSSMVQQEVLSRFDISSEKVKVIHNGVEWKAFALPFDESLQRKKETRGLYGIGQDDFVFLFAGHGFDRKGLSFLLPALAKLKHKAHLLVVGKDKKLPFYQREARRLKIESQVHFVGKVDSMVPYYQMADALVLPTLYDPFANVTLEALAMGLYVVTSTFNGAKEVLTSHTGYAIEDLFDSDAMLEGLKMALKHPKTIESAGLIRQTVEQHSLERQIERTLHEIL